MLVDLRGTDDDVLIGGVPVTFRGDFAQILPVVPHGSEGQIVNACLRKSFVWPRLKQLALRKNVRVQESVHGNGFVRWVQSVPYDPALRSMVTLPAYVKH
ncbi:uncharacterized protein CPUR_05193 [Claviceps purpurea 20.1]|uniref:ATP-dependent DNA helicase n=1 Tax=Claviceps purpurea (strain 20.1) TaxID=1111077 RepID=M1W7V8_CLAP2|nr:uncharacterized protein CPUR_05193 [Claviceps purpurea 20.1]